MKIQKKISLLLIAHLLFFGVGLGILNQLHRSQVTSVLESIREERLEQFETALKLKSESLRATVFDYTYWGDFADFVSRKLKVDDLEAWATDNLAPSLVTFKIDFLGAYSLDGALVYSVYTAEGQEKPVTGAEPLYTAEQRRSLLAPTLDKKFARFFLPTERGFVEMHGAIAYGAGDVERAGEPYGMLFMGRIWNDEVLKEVAQITNSKVELFPGSQPPPVDKSSQMAVEFTHPLPGMDGRPVAFLKVRLHPAFLREFLLGWRLQMWLFTGLVALLGLSLVLGLKGWVFDPLRKLASAVDRGDATVLEYLAKETSEFGRVSALLADFFRQQGRLKDSEERYRALVNDIPGAVYACKWDKERTVEFISGPIQEMAGYPPSDFIQNKVRTFTSMIHPEDRDRVEEVIAGGVLQQRPYVIEYRLVAANGSIKWFYEKGQAVLSPQGIVRHLEGVIFDVTEKKAMETQLMQSQKMETVGTLAAGIAHDLNNQLTPLLGYLNLLLSQMSEADPNRELLSEAEQAGRRSAEIVQRLVRFSRPSAQKKAYSDLKKMFDETVKMFTKFLPSAIVTEWRVPSGLWPVMVNETEIQTLLMNLAANARDAMPEAGKLSISAENIAVGAPNRPPELATGPYVRLTVSDTGKGMTPEVKARIFEPFFTTKKSGGSGLGLAMAFMIMKDHKGVIDVRSTPGKGTDVTIFLPAQPNAPISAEKLADFSRLPRAKQGEVILLADDEEPVRNAGRYFLERLGYRVLSAEDGEVALRVFKENAADISAILMDMTMPKMTGRQCMQQLLRLKPHTKIILSSGFTHEGSSQELVQEGAKAFLPKPYTIEALAEVLRRTLDAV